MDFSSATSCSSSGSQQPAGREACTYIHTYTSTSTGHQLSDIKISQVMPSAGLLMVP